MTIKEMTAKTGVPSATLRYYEGLGLIPKVPRNSAGIRDYTEDYVQWVAFVQELKKSGFSLEAIISYIELAKKGKGTKQERKKIILQTKQTLLQKIRTLQHLVRQADFALNNYEVVVLPRTEELISKWSA